MNTNHLVVIFSIHWFVGFCVIQKSVNFLYGDFSWKDGFSQPGCRLLGEEFIDENLNDVRADYLSKKRTNSTFYQEYWIAAHVLYTKWIRLTGCFLIDIRNLVSIVGTFDTAGCSSYCNGSTFGLTSERCVCFSANFSGEEAFCETSTCPHDSDAFCGSVIFAKKVCICVYEILDLERDNKTGNCKTINLSRGDGRLVTNHCSNHHTFLCQKSDDDEVVLHQQTKNWTEAGFTCYRNYTSQFYNGRLDIRNPYEGQHWVGIFRKGMFQWGGQLKRESDFDCVSVTVDLNGKLKKNIKPCDSRLSLLCEISPNEGTGVGLINETSTTNFTNVLETSTHAYAVNTTSHDLNVTSLLIGLVGGIIIVFTAFTTFCIFKHRKSTVSSREIVNQVPDPNVDTNYDRLNPIREANHYTEIQNRPLTYDYVSTLNTTREYVVITDT
ncbi:uncharacterized protein LOC132553137 [Ylistrum balloti]|uniref:uncharacterized protein LOC132553137 n=1 Tax=Ylistrum balloti TaxID=509963 RepID=UPI0029059B3F|nr:uncharacterized protein LOC132553137 [Ylistrum balloti]